MRVAMVTIVQDVRAIHPPSVQLAHVHAEQIVQACGGADIREMPNIPKMRAGNVKLCGLARNYDLVPKLRLGTHVEKLRFP